METIIANDSISPEVLLKLRETLSEPYHLSRDATIYAEVVTGELNYRGMGELRDALEHIQRAINAKKDNEANENITEAYEHLRRGGVESVQLAANKIFIETLKAIRIPSLALRLSFLEVPDKNKVRELRMLAMKKIADGRAHKSDKDKWMESIKDFKTTIETCFELQDMYPTKVQVRYNLFIVFCGVITIASFLLFLLVAFYK